MNILFAIVILIMFILSLIVTFSDRKKKQHKEW